MQLLVKMFLVPSMAKIERIEILMVDLAPKVRRVDAIQSFESQETPIIKIIDSDGAVGIGYSYTIGQGGPAIMSLLQRTLLPKLIGRDRRKLNRFGATCCLRRTQPAWGRLRH